MKNTTAGKKKDPEPRRIALRIHLDEEDFKLLEEDARSSQRNRTWHAELLLRNAIRATWAYDCGRHDRAPAVTSARDFFSELRNLQVTAMEEIQRAGCAAENAAREAAIRCQHWLDAGKAHQAASTGPKVLDGKFRPVPKGAAS